MRISLTKQESSNRITYDKVRLATLGMIKLEILTSDRDTGIATQNPPIKQIMCKTVSTIGQIVRLSVVGGSNDNDFPMLNGYLIVIIYPVQYSLNVKG